MQQSVWAALGFFVFAAPAVAESVRESASLCAQADDPDVRVANCTAVIQSKQSSAAQQAAAYTERGAALEAEGHHDQAIADESEAINLAPQIAAPYIVRGGAFERSGALAQAITDETKALDLDPGNSEAFDAKTGVFRQSQGRGDQDDAYLFRALAYRRKAQYALSIADFTKAIALAKGQEVGILYVNRGDTYAATELNDEAIADYGRAITLLPGSFQPYWRRGHALASMGRIDDAIADFTKAISIQPGFNSLYDARAAEYLAAGKRAAVADYRAALKLAPNDPDATEALTSLGVTR